MILDSTFIIDLLGNKPSAVMKARELDTKDESLKTTAVNVFEVLQGSVTVKEQYRIFDFLLSIDWLSLDGTSSIIAAEVQRRLLAQGNPIKATDAMISGIVLVNKDSLLTNDIAHFGRIEELSLETY